MIRIYVSGCCMAVYSEHESWLAKECARDLAREYDGEWVALVWDGVTTWRCRYGYDGIEAEAS